MTDKILTKIELVNKIYNSFQFGDGMLHTELTQLIDNLLANEQARVDELEKFVDDIFKDLEIRAEFHGDNSLAIGASLVFRYNMDLKTRRKRERKQ